MTDAIRNGDAENAENPVENNGEVKVQNSAEQSPECCQKCSTRIIQFFEDCFGRLGHMIATHPIKTILIALFLSVLCIAGVMEYYAENRAEKLWVASNSKSLEHADWVSKHYPPQSRLIVVLVETDVLTTAGLKKIIEVDKKVKNISNGPGTMWKEICLDLSPNPVTINCASSTILDVWGNNYTHILSLSEQEMLYDINQPNLRNSLGQPIALGALLGSITRDGSDKMAGASVTKMTYFLRNQQVFVESDGRTVDAKAVLWEEEFSRLMNKQIDGVTLYHYSRTSQRSDSGSALSGDVVLLSIGYFLIMIYLFIMLGSFSRINQKFWLALCGVGCIGLSIGVTYGLSSAVQLFVSPVHSILPFLLLGIGVDDIFVIVQNWENIGGSEKVTDTIPADISMAMRHAGVSILVTSFTDICAFLIGATTILPALRSFCIFAGIGILSVFLLTLTLFIGCLALDSKRQRSFRDACCCCMRLPIDWQPCECSKKRFLQSFLTNVYAPSILSVIGRVVILTITVLLLAGGAYGLSLLKQDFDPDWFLPAESVTVEYNKKNEEYFPMSGVRSAVYMGEVNYFAEQEKMHKIFNSIKSNDYIVASSAKSWYENYISWMKLNYPNDTNQQNHVKTFEVFNITTNEFFSSSIGRVFANDVKRNKKSLQITASRFTFEHISLDDASQEIKAMDSLQDEVTAVKLEQESGSPFEPFAYTRFYVSWETNKVISEELTRNLILAGIIVFLVTFFLIANLWTSLMVVSCVVFTLIDIAGFMHFWGLTVDTVTTIQLILAIGLSVDYSAHIGHAFMASREGSRVERAKHALKEIGPAVIHGGFSTFLAFIFLAGSKSYVFSTFFKIFFLVVVFGMFHGMVYLPVLLSLIGPAPYSSPVAEDKNIEMKATTQYDVKNGKTPTSPNSNEGFQVDEPHVT